MSSMVSSPQEFYRHNWCWLYAGAWYGVCPSCGQQEIVEDRTSDEALDEAITSSESAHKCGPDFTNPSLYEDHYGTTELKRRMGFPEELL